MEDGGELGEALIVGTREPSKKQPCVPLLAVTQQQEATIRPQASQLWALTNGLDVGLCRLNQEAEGEN